MSSDSTPADTKRLAGFGGIEIDQNPPVAFPPWVNSPSMGPRGSRSIIRDRPTMPTEATYFTATADPSPLPLPVVVKAAAAALRLQLQPAASAKA